MLSEPLLNFSFRFLRHLSLSSLSISCICRCVSILISYKLFTGKWTLTKSTAEYFIVTRVDIDTGGDQTLIIFHLCFIFSCIYLPASHSSLSSLFLLKILSRVIWSGIPLPGMLGCHPRSSGLTLVSLPYRPLSPHPPHTQIHSQAHWASWTCHVCSEHSPFPRCLEALVTPCYSPKYKYFFFKLISYSSLSLPSWWVQINPSPMHSLHSSLNFVCLHNYAWICLFPHPPAVKSLKSRDSFYLYNISIYLSVIQ